MINVDSAGQAFAKIISKALPRPFFTRLVASAQQKLDCLWSVQSHSDPGSFQLLQICIAIY
jgi:hypothetical protein